MDLTDRRLHITVSRGMCSEECWAKAWAHPGRRDFLTLLQTALTVKPMNCFLLEFSVLDFQWPQITETAESETANKGTTVSASLITKPLPRCGCCFRSQCPISDWLWADLSLTCSASFVCLFVQLFVYCPWQLRLVGSSGFSQQGSSEGKSRSLRSAQSICPGSITNGIHHSLFQAP